MNVIDAHKLQQAFELKVRDALKHVPFELFTTFDLLVSGMNMDYAALNPTDVMKVGSFLESLGYVRCLAMVDAGAQRMIVEMWKKPGGVLVASKPKLTLVPG